MTGSGTTLDLAEHHAWLPLIPWFLFVVPMFLFIMVTVLDICLGEPKWMERAMLKAPHAFVLVLFIFFTWNIGVMAWRSVALDGAIAAAYGLRGVDVQGIGLTGQGLIDGSVLTYVDADGRIESGAIRSAGDGRFIAVYPDGSDEALEVVDRASE